MRGYSIVGVGLIIPAFLLLSGVSGCGKGKTSEASSVASATTSPTASPGEKPSKGKREAVAGDLVGVLEGKVVYDGTSPKPGDPAPKLLETPDCVKGASDMEKHGQTWIVGPNKEVANVVVFLKPPAGKYFKFDPDKKPEDKSIDQPHCAFIPHVQVVFPTYFDGSKRQKTGQKFVIKNSASFPHNSNISQPDGPSMNPTLKPKQSSDPIELVASYDSPAKVSCNFHPWMNATIWAFDHPYAAVTDTKGAFKIENIPIGTELDVYIRHEGAADKIEKMTFTKDKKTVEFTVKAK